jgi:hypothetical protein
MAGPGRWRTIGTRRRASSTTRTDYYNIYYDQRLSVFRVGFATNRDRARSEIPQQPVF